MEWGQVQKEISKIFSVSLSKIVLFDTIYEEKNLVYCFRCNSMKFVIRLTYLSIIIKCLLRNIKDVNVCRLLLLSLKLFFLVKWKAICILLWNMSKAKH